MFRIPLSTVTNIDILRKATKYLLPNDFPHTNATRQDAIKILRPISVKEMIKALLFIVQIRIHSSCIKWYQTVNTFEIKRQGIPGVRKKIMHKWFKSLF